MDVKQAEKKAGVLNDLIPAMIEETYAELLSLLQTWASTTRQKVQPHSEMGNCSQITVKVYELPIWARTDTYIRLSVYLISESC